MATQTSVFRRRVQKLGGSSLIITLPKQWVKRMNIGVGDSVVIVDEGEYLKIIPESLSPSTRSLSIELSHLPRSPTLRSQFLTCVYAHGYDRMFLYSSRKNGQTLEALLKDNAEVSEYGGIIIKRITAKDSHVIIEFAQNNNATLPLMLKMYASLVNDMFENIIEGNLKRIALMSREASNLALNIIRRSVDRKYNCDTTKITYIALLFTTLPRLLEDLAENISREKYVLNDHEKEILKTAKSLLLELIGALATGSSKRLEQSFVMAKTLGENVKQSGMHGYVSSFAVSIATMVSSASELSICKSKE